MDPNLLSAENYYKGVFEGENSVESRNDDSPWLGSLLANRAAFQTKERKNDPANTRTRANKKKTSKAKDAEETSTTRQRGRPRLNTQDATTAEVRS